SCFLFHLGQGLKDAKIAILGVAFLENSDDTRNSPSKPLYEALKQKGAKSVLHDPYVRDFEIEFTSNFNSVIEDADAIVLMTKHKDYFDLDLNEIKNKMRTPV
ncbi:unnamed protein product, partial [marine sediment metagenome]